MLPAFDTNLVNHGATPCIYWIYWFIFWLPRSSSSHSDLSITELTVSIMSLAYHGLLTRPGKHTKNCGKSLFLWENSLFLWPFSIAMLNNQRVVEFILIFLQLAGHRSNRHQFAPYSQACGKTCAGLHKNGRKGQLPLETQGMTRGWWTWPKWTQNQINYPPVSSWQAGEV